MRVDRRAEFGGEHQPGSAAPPTTPRIKLFHGLTCAKKTRPRRATVPDFPGYTASPQGPDNYFETALNSARAQSTWSYTAARPAVLLSLVRQKWVPVLRARNTLRDHRLSVRGLNFEVLSLRWRGRRGLGHGVRKPDALVCPVRLVAVNTGAKSCAPEAWFAGRHLSAVGQALPVHPRVSRSMARRQAPVRSRAGPPPARPQRSRVAVRQGVVAAPCLSWRLASAGEESRLARAPRAAVGAGSPPRRLLVAC